MWTTRAFEIKRKRGRKRIVCFWLINNTLLFVHMYVISGLNTSPTCRCLQCTIKSFNMHARVTFIPTTVVCTQTRTSDHRVQKNFFFFSSPIHLNAAADNNMFHTEVIHTHVLHSNTMLWTFMFAVIHEWRNRCEFVCVFRNRRVMRFLTPKFRLFYFVEELSQRSSNADRDRRLHFRPWNTDFFKDASA